MSKSDLIHSFVIRDQDLKLLKLRIFGNNLLEHQILWALKSQQAQKILLVAPLGFELNFVSKPIKKLIHSGIISIENHASPKCTAIDELALPNGQIVSIENNLDIQKYKAAFKKHLRLTTGGFVARQINKRISLPLSNLLARWHTSPNFISALGILFTVFGGILLTSTHQTAWAFACFQINSLLDGCDGEVAKMNFSFSDLGKKIDIYSDYLTTFVIFVFGGYHLISFNGSLAPYLWIASISLVLATALIWPIYSLVSDKKLSMENIEGVFHQKLAHPKNTLDRIERVLLDFSRRDFYILMMFLISLTPLKGFIAYHMVFLSLLWFFFSLHTLRIFLKSPMQG